MANAKKNSVFDKVEIEILLSKGDTEAVYVDICDFRGYLTRGKKIFVPRYVRDWLINNQIQVKESIRFIKEEQKKIN